MTTQPVLKKHNGWGVDAITVAGFLALVAVYWLLKVVIPVDTRIMPFSNEDLFIYFPAQHKVTFEMWRHGQIPLWNPYQGCGNPLLATAQAQALYPLNIVYLFLPVHIAMGAFAVLHVFLAGVFTFIFMRTVGASRVGAIVAGILFMFGGPIMVRTFQTSILGSAIWLPLVLTAIHRIIQRHRLVDALLLAVSVWMLLTTGWMQIVMYAFYMSALFTCADLVWSYMREKSAQRLIVPIALLLLGCVFGLGLASAQIVPSTGLSLLSPRPPGGLSIDQIIRFHEHETLRLFARDFLSPGPATRPRQAYVGITTLILGFLAILNTRNRKYAWFFAAMAVLFGVLSLGNWPTFRLYHRLPTGDWFQNPARFRYLWGFALAILAGWGTDLLVGPRKDGVSPRTSMIARSIALVIACGGIVVVAPSLGRLYAIAILVIGAVTIFATRRIVLHVCGAALVLLVLCDMFLSVTTLMARPETSSELFRNQEQTLDFVRDKNTLYRTHMLRMSEDWALIAKAGMLTKTYVTNDYEPLPLKRFGAFYSYMVCGKENCVKDAPFFGEWFVTYTIVNPTLLNLMSARYIAQGPGRDFYQELSHSEIYNLESAAKHYPVVHKAKGITFFENTAALPRAYAVGNAKVLGDEEILPFLVSEEFDPREEVVIEEPVTVEIDEPFYQEAEFVEYSPSRVVVRATCPSGGYLVLTDNYDPGWQARVNGRTTEILRANYTFRAVPVEQGESEVVFEYKPRSFTIGAAISVLTFVILVALVFVRFVFLKSRVQKAVS